MVSSGLKLADAGPGSVKEEEVEKQERWGGSRLGKCLGTVGDRAPLKATVGWGEK